MFMRLILAVGAIAGVASAQTIELFDFELGTSNGTSTSKSWNKNGVTLHATTANGIYAHISGSGGFAGLWFSQGTIASAVYTISFDGAGATYFEIGMDAASGTGGGAAEAMINWAAPGGTPVIGFINVSGGMTAQNTGSLATLAFVQTDGFDNGILRFAFSSNTPFTSVSFTHTQDPRQNGTVIEYIRADIIPTPASATLLGLAGVFASRRRR